MKLLIPASAILPTRNRAPHLGKMLASLAEQSVQPAEIIVVDASTSLDTERLCRKHIRGLGAEVIYRRASEVGAATQRNQAIDYATQANLLFVEDDIVFEPECIGRLWRALESDARLGGVNAMISNQRYTAPGFVSRSLFRLLSGKTEATYAGKCIGPALNLLPEDRDDMPEVVPVDWLNLGCTIYRRQSLPSPAFEPAFTGYSLMEDLSLSLTVGQAWKLANVRTARIFHDSQPGEHKNSRLSLARMELVNRHYVMTKILGRRGSADFLKLALLESFGIATSLASARGWTALPAVALGKMEGLLQIIRNRRS